MRSRIDQRGRVTIPKRLRDELELHPSDSLDIELRDGFLELGRGQEPPSSVHARIRRGKR